MDQVRSQLSVSECRRRSDTAEIAGAIAPLPIQWGRQEEVLPLGIDPSKQGRQSEPLLMVVTNSASRPFVGAAVATCVALLSHDVFAQTVEPSAVRGRELAVRLCASCHVVDGVAITAPAGIGTFRGIANRPGQSAERISNVLILPHMPMPDAQLTREEIQNVLAYLETLRTNPDAPPVRHHRL